MKQAFALSWNDNKRGKVVAAVAAALLMAALASAPAASTSVARPSGRMVGVIVRELSGSMDGPERAVERLGGEVGRHISIIDGFIARVPAGGVELLEDLSGIHSVTPDARVTLLHSVDGYDALTDLGSMHWVAGGSPAPASTGTTASPVRGSTSP